MPSPARSAPWKKDRKPTDTVVKSEEIQPNDVVVPVMGQSGAGKSTFINNVAGREVAAVGVGYNACTQDVKHYFIDLPAHYQNGVHQGGRLVLVDNPSFEDDSLDKPEVLRRIAVWLASSYEQGMSVGGIVYLLSMKSNRMTHEILDSLDIFKEICGPNTYAPIIIGTTHWYPTEGRNKEELREDELKTKFCADMRPNPAIHRLYDTSSSAWEIIDTVLSKKGPDRSLRLQQELVDRKMRIPKTHAGVMVDSRNYHRNMMKMIDNLAGLFRFRARS